MLTTTGIIVSSALIIGISDKEIISDQQQISSENTIINVEMNKFNPEVFIRNIVKSREEFIKVAHLVEPRIR